MDEKMGGYGYKCVLVCTTQINSFIRMLCSWFMISLFIIIDHLKLGSVLPWCLDAMLSALCKF